MGIEVIKCDQGSDEWYAARLGIVTASEFHTVMAKGRGGGESKTRRTYMLKLIGELLTQQPAENYTNHHMERGKAMEDEARDLYSMLADVEPVRVGFVRNGEIGCSPDSLIGDAGMLEIKTKLPHLQLEVILADVLPSEHKAQCQGGLHVAEREWIDFVSYWPGLQPFVKRAYRDEPYIKTIRSAIDDFHSEMRELMEQVRRYSPMQEAA